MQCTSVRASSLLKMLVRKTFKRPTDTHMSACQITIDAEVNSLVKV